MQVQLSVISLSHDGRGVAHISSDDGRSLVVFVRGALPEQRVVAEITARHSNHLEAQCREILDQGTCTKTPCPHQDCGGCPLITMPYEKQIYWKMELLRGNLQRTGHIEYERLSPILEAFSPSPATFCYRNKMEFAFGNGKDGLLLGQRKAGSHEVVETPGCLLMPSIAQELVRMVREIAAKSPYKALELRNAKDRRKKSARADGFWRFLTVRQGYVPGKNETAWWLLLVTSPADAQQARFVRSLAETVLENSPELSGFAHEERSGNDLLAWGEKRRFVLSKETDNQDALLELPLGGERFLFDPSSFFQVNHRSAENISSTVRAHLLEHADAEDDLLDLFCGVGAPGLLMADLFTAVHGVELQQRSVRCALKNASKMHCPNYHCRAGSTEKICYDLPDAPTILVDPPRGGLDLKSVSFLLSRKCRTIIYVSCNPATLARDLARLSPRYHLASIRPIDLFPHTPHIESVALLLAQ